MRRVLAVARKEMYHILRDRRSLTVAIAMPILMLLLYGYAIDMEIKELPVGILDEDHSASSRDFIRQMTSSDFIVDAARLSSRSDVEPGFRRARFRAVLIIPNGFAESLVNRPGSQVQILIDGADATTAAAADNYLKAVVARFTAGLVAGPARSVAAPVSPEIRILFNPELVSANFIVPGLVAIILVMICALLTSLAITREKETGTMEQVLTTPLLPRQLIVGKVTPYLGIGCLDTILILFVGHTVFGVPMAGSWWVLALYSLIYLFIALALGLLISAVANTQRVAMMVALVATLLPTLILSGFIFPRASMPPALQAFGYLIPATYYVEVIRGIMLKGRAWFPFQGGVMVGMGAVLMMMAVRRFGTRLE